MNQLYVSDLHIGLTNEVRIDGLYRFIRDYSIDKIVCHGDTFHLNEVSWKDIVLTADWYTFRVITDAIEVDIIPGNHDLNLYDSLSEHYLGMLPKARVIIPYLDDYGRWHSHWHDYDPIFKLPRWWHLLVAKLTGRKTPRILKTNLDNKAYLGWCQIIHTNILQENKYREYIGGHTHWPMCWESKDLRVKLWNCGDFVDSFSGILDKDGQLEFINFR